MRVKVYKEDCISCGFCIKNMPEIFEMKKDKAKVIKSKIDDKMFDDLKSVIDNCLGDAIELLEK